MDGDDTPCALDAELLEERGGHDGFVSDEAVGVEERTAENAADHDAESSTDGLTAESNHGTASHCAEIGNNLGHSDGCFAEAKLVFEHSRVQVLRAVAHEVEAGHEENKVCQKHPVALESNLAFADKDGPG